MSELSPSAGAISSPRQASVERNTKETQISVTVNLDGTGKLDVETGLPFLDHMLDQIARHGLIDIKVRAVGDLAIDAHHTVEDIGRDVSLDNFYTFDELATRYSRHEVVKVT